MNDPFEWQEYKDKVDELTQKLEELTSQVKEGSGEEEEGFSPLFSGNQATPRSRQPIMHYAGHMGDDVSIGNYADLRDKFENFVEDSASYLKPGVQQFDVITATMGAAQDNVYCLLTIEDDTFQSEGPAPYAGSDPWNYHIWSSASGSGGEVCDADTYAMVSDTDSPNTLPTADTDTNFDSGSVADVKVTSVSYCRDPSTGLPDPDNDNQTDCEIAHGSGAWEVNDCIQKIEFDNKKLLQNECDKVILQADDSGGQAGNVYGLSSSPLLIPLWEIGYHSSNAAAQYTIRIYPLDPNVDTFMGCMVVVPPDSGSMDSCCHLS